MSPFTGDDEGARAGSQGNKTNSGGLRVHMCQCVLSATAQWQKKNQGWGGGVRV